MRRLARVSVEVALAIREPMNGFSAQEERAPKRFPEMDAFVPPAKSTPNTNSMEITSAIKDQLNSQCAFPTNRLRKLRACNNAKLTITTSRLKAES
jgi:hypothetical protein